MIVPCASCGRKNRLSPSQLSATARCGACQTPLTPVATPIEVDTATFDEVLAATKLPVFVDFWAAWCGPCRRAAPEVERTAAALAGRAVVLKVDTEAHGELGARYRVSSIPAFLVFKEGRVVSEHVGLVDARQMIGWLESAATQ